MTDAISRSAVIEDLEMRKKLFEQMPSSLTPLITDTIEMCRIIVEMMPALDVEPVIHAKWIEDGYYEKPSVCSHCGEEAFYISTFRELFDYDWNENLVSCGYEEDREYVHSKRCHNCGAIMDYEEDEENAAD